MNRAFVSLYLIIVLSIILLGLALNKFWDELSPPADIDPAIVDVVRLIEKFVEDSPNQHNATHLNSLTENLNYQVKLVSISNFSKTDIVKKIKEGDIVSISDERTHYFYKRLKKSDDVIMLVSPAEENNRSNLYIIFIMLFYAAIAGVIFLWVWPLARDLARLGLHTQQMGKDGQQLTIDISPRSVLYPFANTFNAMAKRLNEILRSQKEMTLAISHELRTPLARMKFALAMTEGHQLPESVQSQLSNVNKDILEMESLINSFLAYAGFDQQSQQLNQREGYMHDLIQEVILRLSSAEYSHIDIEINDETDGRFITCEWSLMQTAIQNLIHNAFGYAKNKIVISIKILPEHFLIEVEDDGPGVPDEQQSRIFESFVRVYSELTNRSGFGLGLALVKRIVEWHAGQVSYSHSNLGGAKFTIRWPNPRI
ncbi:MAG: two-component sensor histidine kinase [Gammaproteobacteria bacterium]|nr:MAG: two-component sensor histidine kinase [Gammaproteobacteria bacterium]